MSSAQAVSVHHNLLQLLSTEAAAFSGLNLDSSSQDGLFSEAMLSSMKEQGMLMTGAVGAEPGGMDLPAIGDDLPSGGESLAAILQQSLNGGQLDLQRLEAAGRQLEALSYRSVLDRGFSVTRSAGGEILRKADQVSPGQAVQTELADGRFTSRVVGEGAGDDPAADQPKPKPRKPRRRKGADEGGPTLFEV